MGIGKMSIHEASDYSLIVVVAFVIVAAVVMAYCQRVGREEKARPFILTKHR